MKMQKCLKRRWASTKRVGAGGAVSSMLAAGMLLGSGATAQAEESAVGHYVPGAAADFMDMLPGKPALAVADYFMYYDGNANASLPISYGGLVTLDVHSKVFCDSMLAIYETPLKVAGADYGVGLAIPYLWLEVNGQVSGPLGAINQHDSANGIGDMTLYPLMLGWKQGNLKMGFWFGIYAPTGDYEKGRLANLGKNYWTFEPDVSVSWFSKFGLETTAFAGVDFSTRNEDTDYQSGDVFHLDATVAQHLPVSRLGTIGVGVNAFYYQQITADSGSGAVLGDFKGRTVGVGPVISLISKVGKRDLVAEVKWLPELDVKNRLKGDFIWVKVGMAF